MTKTEKQAIKKSIESLELKPDALRLVSVATLEKIAERAGVPMFKVMYYLRYC